MYIYGQPEIMNDRYVRTNNLSHINDLYEKTLNSLNLIIK